jgi:hypothetical protein
MRRTLALCLIALALTTSARADGPGAFTRGAGGWRWSRGPIAIDMKARGSCWSDAEADAMRQALDRLPDVLLKKATRFVHTFYRDPHATNSSGPREANVIATTDVIAGYISFGDNLLAGVDLQSIYFTATHELGHATQYALIGGNPTIAKALANVIGTRGWTSISWTSPITDGLKSWNGFVSDYARTNDREDFAESVEFYWVNPDGLRQVNPAKFAFMRDVVFEGQASPDAARDLGHGVIDRVRPIVTSLGDSEDDAFSLVKVRGTFFMGPLDGGSNTVRYRGTRALHTAVSRSTIWSWVPPIATGQAPITVTTQDGQSDAASFKVTKPWWKFW